MTLYLLGLLTGLAIGLAAIAYLNRRWQRLCDGYVAAIESTTKYLNNQRARFSEWHV
jgi:hypothetical protein